MPAGTIKKVYVMGGLLSLSLSLCRYTLFVGSISARPAQCAGEARFFSFK